MQSTLERNKSQNRAANTKQFSFQRAYPLIGLSLFWLFAVCFIGLSGNFPLNDDWIYAESVEHFLKTGQLRLLACAPACVFQILSAAAVCKVFGFSFEVLRATNLFWAIAGSFFLYGSCRQLRLNKPASLFLTLCFAANPLYMNLAFTFMTDTPAIALTLAYAYYLLKGLRRDRASSFAAASAALIAATLVRQNLGFLALVNGALLLCYWLRKKHSWTFLLGLVIAPLAVGYLADKWMLSTNDFTSLYVWYKGMVGKQISQLLHYPSRFIPVLVQISGELLMYLGLFAAPILACFVPTLAKFFRNKGNISPVFPVLSASTIVFSLCRFIIGESRWMPFSQNLLRIPELGAHTILGINHAALSHKVRETLTWVSGVAGFILTVFLLDTATRVLGNLWNSYKSGFAAAKKFSARARRQGNTLAAFAVLLIFLFQFSFNVLQSTFSDIDRYYLFPFLGTILCLALAWRWHRVKLVLAAAVPLLLVIASYSVAATQDMMAWNRARWTAIQKLEATGVNYKRIEGGAEYNYARDPQLFKNLILHDTWYEFTHRGGAPRDQWRWWTVAGEEYIISFSPVPDYDLVSKETYWSALGGNKEILVLHHVGTKK